MFLIMLLSSKSGFASSWCRQIWDECKVAGRPWKLFFSLFKTTSEMSQRLKMQFSSVHTERGGISHFEYQFDRISSHFSVFFLLKSTSEVFHRSKMQFSPVHTQRGGISHFEFSVTSLMEFQVIFQSFSLLKSISEPSFKMIYFWTTRLHGWTIFSNQFEQNCTRARQKEV